MYVVLLLNTHGKNNSDELWIGFLGSLNEVQARQLAGIKALEFGWGGISKVGRLTGKDYKTIKKRITEVENGKFLDKNEKLRKKGAGRKKNLLIKILKS